MYARRSKYAAGFRVLMRASISSARRRRSSGTSLASKNGSSWSIGSRSPSSTMNAASSTAPSCGAALTPVTCFASKNSNGRLAAGHAEGCQKREELLDVLDVLVLFALLAFLPVLSALLAVKPPGVGALGALGRPFRLSGGVGFVGSRRVEREGGARNEHAEGERGDESQDLHGDVSFAIGYVSRRRLDPLGRGYAARGAL